MNQIPASPRNPTSVRLRTFILGTALAIGICAITPYNNMYRQATPIAGGHFPLFPFYIFLCLTILSWLINKVFQTYVLFSGVELILIFALMLLTSGIAYTGLTRTFFVNLTAPYHFSTIENRWNEALQPFLPHELLPDSQNAIETLYNGIAGGRTMGWIEILKNIPWKVWISPLSKWSIFIFLSYFIMFCIASFLKRQAYTHERMNFPLLEVPTLLSDAMERHQLGSLLSNRFLVSGMSIPLFLHLINGMSVIYPSIPQIPTLVLAGTYFPETGLFSGFSKLKIFIYPAFIGFAFLTSKQVSFSFFFFFLIGSLLFGLLMIFGYHIPGAALSTTFGPTLSRPEEMQTVGATLIFFFFLFWMSRQHFADILKSIFVKKTEIDKKNVLFHSIAYWGAIIGILSLSLWMNYFGVPFFWALIIILFFFIFTLVATRVICQGGVAYFTLTAAPIDGIISILGPNFIPKTALVISCISQKVLFLDLRESLMPSIMHAQKLTHRIPHNITISILFFFSLVTGVIISILSTLMISYKYGIRELGLDWATQTTLTLYTNLYTTIQNPQQTGYWVHIFIIGGAFLMLLLILCYHRFYWWPLHPIGYLMAYSSAMKILWFSFFLGWLFNALCMRYGGAILYKKTRFFFAGLIIGDFFMGGTWAIIGLLIDANYNVLPL